MARGKPTNGRCQYTIDAFPNYLSARDCFRMAVVWVL